MVSPLPPLPTASPDVPLHTLDSAHLRVQVAPALGGRVTSLVHKGSGHEFLWRHPTLPLRRAPFGAEYDPVFWGGIDELLPNDLPEEVDGLALPDHGELWTTALDARPGPDPASELTLSGDLPHSGLSYWRRMRLLPDAPVVRIDYRITNLTARPRHVLFKLHAAVAIRPGDRILCPAGRATVADPAYSRWPAAPDGAPRSFAWPHVPGVAGDGADGDAAPARADLVPPMRGEMDFLYLHELRAGEIGWTRPDAGLLLRYRFDPQIFPCAWLFASYGGFQGHEVAILEPCTTMPISLREAQRSGVCTVLPPHGALVTSVELFAGTAAAGGAEARF